MWEWELAIPISPEEWAKPFLFTHKLSIAPSAQETNFKIITRWYHCPPDLFDSFYTLLEMQCRQRHHDSYLVILPPYLTTAATGPNSTIYAIIIPHDPKTVLLSILPGTSSKMKKGMLRYHLTAVKAIIPHRWKSASPPTIDDWLTADWLAALDHISAME